ncbi:MAG: hypothetical protein U0350_48615 [Caldilineaceae bacterium]
MRNVEFHRRLDDENVLRVRFSIEHGQVLEFMVQLECRFEESERWVPVVRYDTAHGFAHCDRLHPYNATTKTAMATRDYNEALDVAMKDLALNWAEYRRIYIVWLKQQ